MRRVLRLEKLWLKEVRYQFAFGLREQTFDAMKTYVKYRRAKKTVKMNRYRHLLRQLTFMVQNSRLRQAQATVYQQ